MKTIITLGVALLLLWSIKPASAQQVQNTAAVTGTPKDVTPAERQRLEEEYLRQARENIEKYRKGQAQLTVTDAAGKVLRNVKVEVNQLTQDFLFGNLSEEVLRPNLQPEEAQKFTEMFRGLYNFTELTVKWSPYEGQQGKPEWQKLQEKLDWCKQNGVTPKGHTLGWTHTAGTPRWLLKLPAEQATDLYRARIQNLVAGFKDQIHMWDVVNEPVTTVPWERALKDSQNITGEINEGTRYNVKGITLEEILPWVENSYRWAHQADPMGDFIINEFYVIARPEVREKYYQLIKELKKRNVPVTGIGIQAHEPQDRWFSPVEVLETFNRLNEFGLPLHITEFIPQSSGKAITGGWREGTWTEETQADFAEQFYTLAFSYPAMVSIHWWGFSDRMIWLKGGGLVDKDFNPKPVYTRLKKMIKEDWMTKNVKLSTDKSGQAGFRGFGGRYQVVVTQPDGSQSTREFHLKENENNQWRFSF